MNGEFRMITDLATVAPKELLFNYDELKAFLTDALQEYKTLVVTQDAIPEAKAKRAKLNKLADNLDSYRIYVKKQIMEQYDTDFAPKVNELKSMTKEASDSLSAQIKEFERQEAEAKLAEIKAVYDSDEREEARVYCPWERVYNPKWANKGYDIDEAKEEIRAALFYTVNDIQSIRDMGGDDTAYLLDIYRQTHDLNAVIRKKMDLQTAKEREEQRKREAEERAAKETAEKPKIEPQITSASDTTGDLVTVDFRVVCTNEQLANLGKYMRDNGIKYGRVP